MMMSTVASNSRLIRTRFRISGFGSAYPSGTLTNRELADQFGVTRFGSSPAAESNLVL